MNFSKNRYLFLFLGFLILSSSVFIYFKDDLVSSPYLLNQKIFLEENKIKDIGEIEVYFCPKQNCDEKIISQINSAKKSIDIAVYSFTLDSIFDSIKLAQKRGVRIRVIFDYLQSFNAYSLDENLIEMGVPIMRKKGVSGFGVMHNKFVIIDEEIVLTGSFNYSTNANKNNFENLLFIDNKKIAEKYIVEFNQLWLETN